MPGMKRSKKHGMWKGTKPAAARDFVAGEKRTIDAARKGGQARKEQFARYRSLREAAVALRDLQAAGDPKLSNGVAVIDAMYREAAAGDSKCATFLANIMGEMVEKVDVQNLPIIRDDVPRMEDPHDECKT